MRLPLRRNTILAAILATVVLSILFFKISNRSDEIMVSNQKAEDNNHVTVKSVRSSDSLNNIDDQLLILKDNEIRQLREQLKRMSGRYEMLLSNRHKQENATNSQQLYIPATLFDENGILIKTDRPKINDNSYTTRGTTPLKEDPLIQNMNPTYPDSPRTLNPVQAQSHLDIEIPQYRAESVDCARLFAGDAAEAGNALKYTRPKISGEKIQEMAKNCAQFLTQRQYVVKPLNEEESQYSIAYSIIMFDEIEHFERLLRAIYRPQNHYCIHLDSKAYESVRKAVQAVASCLPNVFLASKLIDVQWGQFSVVEAELICMEDLLARASNWRYFINLTGQEFPLKTNWDLVQILKVFNESNNMEGTVARRDDRRVTNKPKLPVPITLTKGSVHVVVTRAFVEFILKNEDVQKFKDWVKDTYVPDETFFSSLNHSPQLGVPGAYLGTPETDTDKYMFVARFKNWGDGPFNWPCYGQRVRYICIFGVGDLPLLASRPELFANKFYADYQPATLDCMEELHFNRTRDEYLGKVKFDTSFYKRLSFVSNHI